MARHGQITFKAYQQDQMMLMPRNLEELVPSNHKVRMVDAVIEEMSLDPLLSQYKGGGTSSYHPKMMLKVLVYAYTERLYSSRRIAKALRENVLFMWLSGQQRPDFRTLNRFRGEMLREAMEPVFAAVLELLLQRGYIGFKDYFVDGTKVEANAGRYTFVWKKSVKRYKAKVRERVRELLRQAEEENAAEDAEYGDRDLEEVEGEPISAEELEQKAREIEERLKRQGGSKAAQKAVKALQKDCMPRLRRYEEQERMLGERNSCSKTDPDSTFMRMKETTAAGAPLKAGYNVQIGTENQFVLGYSIHQRHADTGCLIPHLEQSHRITKRRPGNVIADAGYGSEENYAYLAAHGLGNYVKYNTFYQEQRPRRKPDPLNPENWPHDAEHDAFRCPAGQALVYRGIKDYVSDNGFRTHRRMYEAEGCEQCAWSARCTPHRRNRCIMVSPAWRTWKSEATLNLTSQTGRELRARRLVEPETVFACLKHNWGFRRFSLRGLEKVRTEWGLLCVAHNVARLATLAA